jgi:hypothetical protein
LSLGACFVQSSDSVGGGTSVTEGTLSLHWTLNGTTDTNQCVQGNTDAFRIVVNDARGNFFGEYSARCSTFGTTISLPPGQYSGRARLVDSNTHDRTTTIDVVPWHIAPNETFDVKLDFPASSFLQTTPTSL